jgi:hypothetical protein
MPEAEDTASRLARIEVKLDLALTRYEDHELRIRRLESHGTADIAVHDARITALERWKYSLPATSLIAAVEGAFIIWKLVGAS